MPDKVCEPRLTHAGTPEHAFGKPYDLAEPKRNRVKTLVKCSWCGWTKAISVRKLESSPTIRHF